jgi:hypothetical protein
MRNRTARQGIVMALAIAIPAVLEAQERPAYRDASLPVAHRVRDLLGRMTLDEKFWQLYMIPGAPWDSGTAESHAALFRGQHPAGHTHHSVRGRSARADAS